MNKDYVGYEYCDVTIKKKYEPIYMDGYENYGWNIEERETSLGRIGQITLNLKRDRNISNKAELSRLQKQFESYVKQLDILEASKYITASTIAYVIGIIGCAFVAASVFAITAAVPNLMLCIILGVFGFVGWIVPYLCYRMIVQRKTKKVKPLIHDTFEEIYQVNQKAHSLL